MTETRVVVVSRDPGRAAYAIEAFEPSSLEPGRIRVRTEAAGVSLGDVFFQRGAVPGGPRPPYVPGCDLVGVVDSIAPDVLGIRPGDRVAALVPTGGFATVADVPAEWAVPVPGGVLPRSVAAVALNHVIARQMLFRVAAVGARSRVLVHAASGGVGLAFLQTLRQVDDVTVWGTASSDNAELLREHGAIPIDYRTQDVRDAVRSGGAALDAVFDPIGGASFRRSYSLLRRGGTLVAYGQSDALRGGRVDVLAGGIGFIRGIAIPKLLPDRRRTRFYDAFAARRASLGAYREDLGAALRDLREGRIAPRSVRALPLADAAGALESVESGVRGKVVLEC